MMSIRSLVAVALGGCADPAPLGEVPIEGGTAEQRALVRKELLAFEQWVGPDRIVLRSVRFAELSSEKIAGKYRWSGLRVLLDPGIPLHKVRRFVRHELCHALDYQESLLSSPVRAFDSQVGRFIVSGVMLDRGGSRILRSEVLAEVCEIGPALAVLLRERCPIDPDDLVPISEFVVNHVWTGEIELSPDSLRAEASAHHDAPFPPDDILVAGAADGRAANLALIREDGEVEELWVDLATGGRIDAAPAHDGSGRFDLEPALPLPLGLGAPAPSPGLLPTHTVVQGERALVVVDARTQAFEDALGQIAPRAVLLDGDQWHPVDACPGEVATVFTTPGQLWLAWAEGARIQWAPIGPPAAP